tara:strand:+ start:761 stop:1321 length:561 start_codon:yes stop_codon:yes gene_type:complete
MAKTKISVENFRDYYLKQNKPRSIRRLHTELREQFKNKSLVSLPTIFRHSKSEDWKNLCISVDQKSSAIAMENIVEKKAVQLTEITEQLKETSDKALQIVLQNLNNIKSLDKVADIGTISKVAIESAKLSNLFSGGATSISSTFISDGQDVASLKNHIKELYDSIQNDISKQQEPNIRLVKKDTKH